MAYTTKKYILFGGDYNPNQWDEATLRQDMIYFREAKINTVVLPVFSWAKLEPSEGQYNFGWLDHILDVLEENGIAPCGYRGAKENARNAGVLLLQQRKIPGTCGGHCRCNGAAISEQKGTRRLACCE